VCVCVCVLLYREQRLKQDQKLSHWRQRRRSVHRSLKRLRDDAQERLNSLVLWRGDIHLIEGERGEVVVVVVVVGVGVHHMSCC